MNRRQLRAGEGLKLLALATLVVLAVLGYLRMNAQAKAARAASRDVAECRRLAAEIDQLQQARLRISLPEQGHLLLLKLLQPPLVLKTLDPQHGRQRHQEDCRGGRQQSQGCPHCTMGITGCQFLAP